MNYGGQMFMPMKAASRVAGAACLVTLVLLPACGGDSSSSSSVERDLSNAMPAAYVAHGSVEQLYVTGAEPGQGSKWSMGLGLCVVPAWRTTKERSWCATSSPVRVTPSPVKRLAS